MRKLDFWDWCLFLVAGLCLVGAVFALGKALLAGAAVWLVALLAVVFVAVVMFVGNSFWTVVERRNNAETD